MMSQLFRLCAATVSLNRHLLRPANRTSQLFRLCAATVSKTSAGGCRRYLGRSVLSSAQLLFLRHRWVTQSREPSRSVLSSAQLLFRRFLISLSRYHLRRTLRASPPSCPSPRVGLP